VALSGYRFLTNYRIGLSFQNLSEIRYRSVVRRDRELQMRSPNPSVQGNQRVCNGMHGECDPILPSNLAHQLGYVRLDRALPDAQWGADFLVRAPFYQHL